MSQNTKDRHNLLTDSKSFCMAPWAIAHVTALGKVTACCEVQKPFADINDHSLDEIWNGPEIRSFRTKLLNGEKDARCRKCYDREEAGNWSLRQQYNKKLGGHVDWVEEMTPDGHVKNAKPVLWDVRFSNICNFRCRTCWHGASSRWFADAKAMGQNIAETAIIPGVEDPDQLLDQLVELMPTVEEIYFAGGEPLITDAHYRILKELDARQRYDVRLRYNTNLSELAYKDLDVRDLWVKFENIKVDASVDGIGKRGELIRKEKSWEQFVDNCKSIRQRCPNVQLRTHSTISVFNVFHTLELQRTIVENGLVQFEDFSFGLAQDPAHYNVRILPKSMKRRAAKHLSAHRTWIREYGIANEIDTQHIERHEDTIDSLVTYMMAEDWSNHINQFQETTRTLDRLREESTAEILPELAPLIKKSDWRNIWRWRKKQMIRLFQDPNSFRRRLFP